MKAYRLTRLSLKWYAIQSLKWYAIQVDTESYKEQMFLKDMLANGDFVAYVQDLEKAASNLEIDEDDITVVEPE